MKPVEVYKYEISKLKSIIKNSHRCVSDSVLDKCHFDYFEEYFKYIGAKTIVVEKEYVDKDFLEDYSAYYVRCFSEYDKKCTRLHFFSISFSKKRFNGLLEGKDEKLLKQLNQKYLGFVVVKPLPLTVIGRTCLVSYPHENRRYYPIKRNYLVSLFGIKLVINGLAYQEQDTVVAACATSALWSVFHGTGYLFHHSIPSPASITKVATENFPVGTRSMPNKGLTIESMAHAIKSLKLEPILIAANKFYLLKTTIYAYMKLGLPIVLCFELFDTKKTISIGLHAVAITGYSLDSRSKSSYPKLDFTLKACNIHKIYVHDDQIGPFARMEFDGETVNFDGIVEESMSTCWKDDDGNKGNIRALNCYMLIPVYHTIRVSLEAVLELVVSFNQFFNAISALVSFKLISDLEWDVYLDRIDKLKEEILLNKYLSGDEKTTILLTAMPKYIWRASAYNNEDIVIDLLFDATDFDSGDFFMLPVMYSPEIDNVIRQIVKLTDAGINKAVRNSPILTWFKNN